MNVIPFALLAGFSLAAVAVSLFTTFRAHTLVTVTEGRAQAGVEESEAAIRSLRAALDGLSEDIKEIRQQPQLAMTPAIPKPGLNLSKRSQALRMHRRGDSPQVIAASLQVPQQEVDLLLKVHRILISNL
jgi:hypothetical protein